MGPRSGTTFQNWTRQTSNLSVWIERIQQKRVTCYFFKICSLIILKYVHISPVKSTAKVPCTAKASVRSVIAAIFFPTCQTEAEYLSKCVIYLYYSFCRVGKHLRTLWMHGFHYWGCHTQVKHPYKGWWLAGEDTLAEQQGEVMGQKVNRLIGPPVINAVDTTQPYWLIRWSERVNMLMHCIAYS